MLYKINSNKKLNLIYRIQNLIRSELMKSSIVNPQNIHYQFYRKSINNKNCVKHNCVR